MTLSKKCEYTLLALIEMACRYEDGQLLSAAQMAAHNEIPLKFLEQILGMLRVNGYVFSVRGAGGGYRLAKTPGEITLAEIIRMIDGPIAPIASVSKFFYQKTPTEKNERLLECFQDIRDYTAAKLEAISLDQLV